MLSPDSVQSFFLDNQEQDVVSEYTIGSSDTSTVVSSRSSSLGSCTRSSSVTHSANTHIHSVYQDHGEEAELPIGSSTPEFSYTDSSPNAHALSEYSPDELVYLTSDGIARVQPPSNHSLSGPDSEDASLFLECLDRLLQGLQREESRLSSSDNGTNDEHDAELLDEYLISGWDATRSTSGSRHSSSSGLPGLVNSARSGRQPSLHTFPATTIKRKLSSTDLAYGTTHLAAEATSQQSSWRSLSSSEALDGISSSGSRTSSKRRKLSQVSSVFSVSRSASGTGTGYGLIQLATEPATLRKARSLRSDASICAPASKEVRPSDTDQPELSTECSTVSRDHGYIATEPVTPVVSRPASPVPIPLPEYIPRAPLCSVEAAERRLCALLRREERERAQADLPTTRVRYQEDASRGMAGSDTSEEDSCMSVSQDEDGESTCNGGCEGGTSQDQDFGVGIRDGLRTEAMNWILTVVPPYDLPSHIRRPSIYSKDLYEQLLQHPDTRFLAAYIFGRYFLACKSGDSGCTTPDSPASPNVHNAKPVMDARRRADLEDGERRLVWDFALAAIVLSVKVQRDFLPPLRPVYIRDFLVLAPHEMSHDDLEAAQRDILHALSYCISVPTPEAYLDELYSALPALHQLTVALGGCAGWDTMRKDVWARLLAAVQEPDLFRFPVSVLVAGALQRGISSMLVRHEGRQLGQFQDRAGSRCASQIQINQRRIGPVSRLAWGIQQDIQNILQVPQVLLDECKRWLAPLRFENPSGQDWFDHASST